MEELINNLDFKNIYLVTVVCVAFILSVMFILNRYGNPIKKKRASMNMFGYTIIYADQKEPGGKSGSGFGTVLYSAKYDIQGKPDYIFKKNLGGQIMPVEIKSGEIGSGNEPHKGDLLQLGAYFLIINDVYGVKPKFGRLVYKDYMFVVKNTHSLRKEVTKTLARMRSMLKSGEEECNASFPTCRYCICNNTVCEHCASK